MTTFVTPCSLRRSLSPGLCLASLLVLGWGPGSHAAPPIEPLPAPYYSFDLDSPSVGAGLFGAADILSLATPYPIVVVPAAALQAFSAFDDLDALSDDHASMTPSAMFAILFSVDRATVGQAPPDAWAVTEGVPFNVFDQAERGQAAGDQYISLDTFTRERGRAANNVLVRNNYDEGGTDFGAVPQADSYGNPLPALTRELQDNVDATNLFPDSGGRVIPYNVYFSLTADSPSLVPLSYPEPPSGANIFFNPNPLAFTPTQRYATFIQLGLVPPDDIDAMIIFDTNGDGVFNELDRVVFSLAPGSPSLNMIPGNSGPAAAADLFVATPGQPPMLYVPAAAFGLGYPSDNIDALDLVLCDDPLDCAARYGIRALKGDLNCDNAVNFGDINPFVLALSNPGQYHNAFPGCFIQNGDINRDGAVNFGDINPFVALLTGGAGPARSFGSASAR